MFHFLGFRVALAGPHDPQLPFNDVIQNVKPAFNKEEKLEQAGKEKAAMSLPQKCKLESQIQHVIQEYRECHAGILIGANTELALAPSSSNTLHENEPPLLKKQPQLSFEQQLALSMTGLGEFYI